MEKPPVTLIEGGLGSGKTTIAVAKIVDAYNKAIRLGQEPPRIFSNMHLYGVKYVYDPRLALMVANLNNDLLTDGYQLIDESYTTADATCQSNGNRIVGWYAMGIRKRRMQAIFVAQHGRFLNWRIRFLMKERILACGFNKQTKYVKCIISDLEKQTDRTVSFYAPNYWPYYDTNELPEIPMENNRRAQAWVS